MLVITNDLYLFTKADTWTFDNLLKLLIQVIKYTQEGNSCILDFYSTIQSENIYWMPATCTVPHLFNKCAP